LRHRPELDTEEAPWYSFEYWGLFLLGRNMSDKRSQSNKVRDLESRVKTLEEGIQALAEAYWSLYRSYNGNVLYLQKHQVLPTSPPPTISTPANHT
jgi:hypothetical protein